MKFKVKYVARNLAPIFLLTGTNCWAQSGMSLSDGPRVEKIFRALESGSMDVCKYVHHNSYETSCAGPSPKFTNSISTARLKSGIIEISETFSKSLDDDELAFVISHEISHKILQHQKSSHTNEISADILAIKIMAVSGFNPRASIKVLRKGNISWILNFPFSLISHPNSSTRIKNISSVIETYKPI